MEFFETGLVEDEKSTKKKIKGGIDVHKSGCNIFLLNEREEKVKEKRIQTNYESFSKFFSPFLQEYDVEVALECGNLAFVICDYLSALGAGSYVVNAFKNRLIAETCQKSDKRDAKTLGYQLSKRILPPRVYHPTYRERELRSLVNHRHKLVADRTRAANRAFALLLRNGIFGSKSYLRNNEEYWKRLLRERLVSESNILYIEFKSFMEQYQLCNRQIGEMEAETKKHIASMYQFQYELLLGIPGVGHCIASVVLAYLGIIERFENVRHFWSYYGMAPSGRETDGKKVGSSKITKMGPSILRGYLTQGALSILKNKEKEENKPFVEFYQRIRSKKGWKKARVALGKKLLGIIYGVLKNQTAYNSNYAQHHNGKRKVTDTGAHIVAEAPEAQEALESGNRLGELELDDKRQVTEPTEPTDPTDPTETKESTETTETTETTESKHRQPPCEPIEIELGMGRLLSIEEIKSLHMVEFLTHQYGLCFLPSGNQYVCRSPFTKEQKPSLTVGQFRGHWLFKDFSSGHGGSLIDFVLLKENFCNVAQTLAYLRKLISGNKLEWLESKRSGPHDPGVGNVKLNGKEKKKDYNLNYIYRKLYINEKEVCWKYLKGRGIGQELISELSNRGILLHNRYKGHSYCCFAVFDSCGSLQCLDNHQVESKGKFVLGKKHIFTLDWAVLPGAKKVFISEGIIDYLSIKTLEPDIPGLALLGNAPNFDESLFQSATVLVSALDCDAGGIRALLSLKEKFPGKNISPYNLAGCKDPNEYLQTLILGKKAKNVDSMNTDKHRCATDN
jgi:transposase